jgi:hypothetical protein
MRRPSQQSTGASRPDRFVRKKSLFVPCGARFIAWSLPSPWRPFNLVSWRGAATLLATADAAS